MCHTSQKYIFLGTFNIGSSLNNMNQDADHGGRREFPDNRKLGDRDDGQSLPLAHSETT